MFSISFIQVLIEEYYGLKDCLNAIEIKLLINFFKDIGWLMIIFVVFNTEIKKRDVVDMEI
jgi:hypothetical protein